MGGPKALLDVNGESLLQRAVRIAREAGCDTVVAVVGDWDPGPLAAQVVPNRGATEGLASSLRAGITALPRKAERALVMTVDQVTVDAPLLARLLALSAAHPDQPAACAYADTVGVPAVFPRRLFTELGALRGDHGAKAILLRETTSRLAFPEGVADLDTPEDLSRFKR
jgi:CTP:molybdopterin cytidylyltransferase MocA